MKQSYDYWLKKTIFISFTLITLCISYSNNFFFAANQNWYQNFQLDSEQLVLDGILRDGPTIQLGRYERPQVTDQFKKAHELFEERNQSGNFKVYKSQFGLQVKIFDFLNKSWDLDISSLKIITAFLMSVVLTGILLTIHRDFSIKSSIALYFLFLLSPWLIAFSNNLYWISFSWFLPLLVSAFFAPLIYKNSYIFIIYLVILFFAYIFKFLSGYEYITTIVLSSVIPILYHGGKKGVSPFGIGLKLINVFMVSVIAFIIAIYIHGESLSTNDTNAYEIIKTIGAKRFSSSSPDDLVNSVCGKLKPPEDQECTDRLTKSLTANPILVTAKYFYNSNFLPWINIVSIEEDERQLLKNKISEIIASKSIFPISTIDDLLLFKFFFYLAIKFAGFLFLMSIIILILFRIRHAISYMNFVLLLSFVAPISWFFLAKGHSAIHTHLNYVLWYLFFIPFALIYIIEVKRVKND